MLLQDNAYKLHLPTAEELPHTDDTPVDNELQHLILDQLRAILARIWSNRDDWFFGTDLAWYYDPNLPQIVPDGFLSLGVERIKGENMRLSYVLWQENWIVPTLALEIVSKTPGGEYKRKKTEYARLGVLYYVIYAPLRRRQPRLLVYRLYQGTYQLIEGNPIWLPELGLGIGCELGTYQGNRREWLYWYDAQGNRFFNSDEVAQQERQARLQAQHQAQQERQRAEQERQRAEQERQRAEQERQRAEQLAAQLRALGIEPDEVTD